ncbi:MFS transporter [Uliginosibacterium gangwonense]|uniref:MFS transporter n=1 Tax=Uliginosibacterium gangwonense TaxID=392736 RepID=UPI000375A5E3|nr:MFS transporter [Uliginosibacterium gangwonense]
MSHHPLPAHEVPRWLGHVMGLVTAVDFLSSLSVLLASSEIRGGIFASPSEFLWILTVYAAAGMSIIPLIERAARRWHYRSLMAAGIALFIGGAIWAAMCDSLGQMIFARIVQGVGGGGLFTMSRVYLQLAVPAKERPAQLKGYMLGILGSTAPMSWLTTELVQDYGWQAVFVLQAVFALLVLLLVLLYLKAERHTPRSLGDLDWPMALSFSLGMLLLLHGLEDMELLRLDAHQILMFIVALSMLGFAIWRIHQHHDPLLDARVINGRRYIAGLGFYCLYYLINGATSYIYPLFFAGGLGLPLTTTGGLLSFASCATVVLLPLYFALAPKLGDRRRVIAAGFAIAAIALIWMGTRASSTTAYQALLLPMALKGIFPILGVIQIAGLTYKEVPHEDFAHAYALKNIVRQLSNVFAAGLVSQHWQRLSAEYRNVLVQRIDIFNPIFTHSPYAQDSSTLQLLSTQIDQQVTVLVGNTLLMDVAILCLIGIPLVLLQKRLH